ncbi:uncharacterized protein METZ01_LOCUS109889 [marine metagenome]|uniref:Protein kinase domain-containing protein n=1 Tax=marine metagenome TaxID=408172 RepID=A0A381WWY5_9ZZZZ
MGQRVGDILRIKRSIDGPWGVMKPDSILDKLCKNPHPLLLNVHDFCEDWIVVEYLEKPLMLYLHNNPRYKNQESWMEIHGKNCDAKCIDNFKKQIKEAVGTLHKINLLHGDLQVNNVVIPSMHPHYRLPRCNKNIKLIDYGSIVDLDVPLEEHGGGIQNPGVTSKTVESENKWMERMFKELDNKWAKLKKS